jgi:tetratricopeptide (TPR) repeat protein
LKDLGEELVGAIVALAAPGVEWEAGGRRPPSYAAYREFMAGMAFLPSLNFESAIEHWFRAARLDSTFVAPLLSAASFMLVSGQSARADSLVSSIQLKRDQLRPSERQRLDNLSARVRGNISAALAALRPLAVAAPVSEVAWELALHELWLNRPREAIRAFAALDPSWELLRGWWFYWIFYANAYHVQGSHEEELKLARRARKDYPKSIPVAEPEMASLAALHRVNELRDVVEEISAMPSDPPGDLSRALMIAAEELRAHGHLNESAALLRRALDSRQDSSLPQEAASVALISALITYLSGDWAEARKRYADLVARDSTDLNARGHLGVIAARMGDRSEAQRISGWLGGQDGRYLYGYHTLWRARIAALLGDQDRAIDLLRTAFGQGLKFVGTFGTDPPARTFGPWLHRDIDFESMRASSRFQQVVKGWRQ